MSTPGPGRATERAYAGPKKRLRGRLILAGLFVMFFAPVLTALWLNVVKPGWLPLAATNNGTLVQPARLLEGTGLEPFSADGHLEERWTLLLAPSRVDASCDQLCQGRLVEMNRTRVALGKEMDRLRVLVVLPESSERAAITELLDSHPGLDAAVASPSWSRQVEAARAAEGGPGQIFLVDPQAYLMMRYAPDATASEILKDLKRLLRISKIG